MDDPLLWLATGLGLGYSPWAAGSVGSLLGLPLAWWLAGRSRRGRGVWLALLLVGAMPLCQLAETRLQGEDDGRIVLDEIVALPLAVSAPLAARHPATLAAAFVLYRAFDIAKPPPVAWAEGLPGGVGVVLDDSLAALLAWLVLATTVVAGRRWRPA